MFAGRVDQSGADQNVIGAIAKLDANAGVRSARGEARNARETALQRCKDMLHDNFVRPVAREHGKIRKAVHRVTICNEPLQRLLGVHIGQQRPITALAHTAQQHIEIGLQPDGDAMLDDILARLRRDERAAACRQNALALFQQAGHHAPFAVAKISLAVLCEDFRHAHARGGFDLRIGVGKIQPEPRRQTAPDGRLAGPHHTHEHDRAPAQRAQDGGGAGVCTPLPRSAMGAASVVIVVLVAVHKAPVPRQRRGFKRGGPP